MDLFEFEGKALLKKYGIAVPDSFLITSKQDIPSLPFPFILKAQVLTGGRGKAGGVRKCFTKEEYDKYAEEILSMRIQGHQVYGLLAEKLVPAEKEMYLSLTISGVKTPTLIFCRKGGMEIEQATREKPEDLFKMEIDPFIGLKTYQIRMLKERIPEVSSAEIQEFLKAIQTLYKNSGAKLIEINPLGVVDGHLIAMDAKISLDDYEKKTLSFRETLKKKRVVLKGYSEKEEEKTTLTFIPLSGNVGLISDGAGTGMLSLDLLGDRGIHVSSFGELGAMITPDVMYHAMEKTVENNPNIQAFFIVLIGGFNRMDNMAKGIVSFLKDHDCHIPVFCRMCGTNENEGRKIMEENHLPAYDVLDDAICALSNELKGA